jgi:hypothetical protein
MGDPTVRPHAQPLCLGWATGDVTPPKPCIVAGQFHTRVSEYVQDPLTATALAVESADGAQRAVIMSADAVAISDAVREQFDRLLRERLPDLPPDCVLISATHTHTGPAQPRFFHYDLPPGDVMTPDECGAFLAERLTDIAAEAWAARAPGAVAWGYGTAVIGYNRRAVYRDGSAVMYGPTGDPLFTHLEGHENHGVDLLFTYDPNHALTGMVVNVGCPSQCTEGANFISADFWHETRLELRRRFGEGLHVLAQCGAAGDQSPHLMLDRRAQERMFRLQGLLPETGGDFNMAQRTEIARRIAAAVQEVLPAVARDIRDEVAFAHARSLLPVPLRRLTPTDVRTCHERIGFFESRLHVLQQGGADPLSPEASSCAGQLRYYQRALERGAGPAGTLPVEIHALRLGEMALVSNRFEFMLDFGDRIRGRSPAEQTFVVQLAGDGSYLATDRAERGGGYGAWFASALVGSDGGQMIVEESLRLIGELFA